MTRCVSACVTCVNINTLFQTTAHNESKARDRANAKVTGVASGSGFNGVEIAAIIKAFRDRNNPDKQETKKEESKSATVIDQLHERKMKIHEYAAAFQKKTLADHQFKIVSIQAGHKIEMEDANKEMEIQLERMGITENNTLSASPPQDSDRDAPMAKRQKLGSLTATGLIAAAAGSASTSNSVAVANTIASSSNGSPGANLNRPSTPSFENVIEEDKGDSDDEVGAPEDADEQ